MDKNGIGTDSTIHEHIKKIQVRKYAYKKNLYIFPTKLGTCLIKGYNIFNLEFSTPKLRAEFELKLKKIEKGEIFYQTVIKEELLIYEKYFLILQQGIDSFKNTFLNEENNNDDSTDGGDDNEGNNKFSKFIDLTKEDNKENKKKKTKSENLRKGNENLSNLPNTKNNNEKNKFSTKTENLNKENMKKDNQNTTNFENSRENTEKINLSENDIQEIIKIKRLKCNCGKPPKNAVVKKESPNSGKLFFFCGTIPKKCKFFLWFDELDNYRTLTDVKIEVKCDCGFEPKAEISRSENNKGKIYLKCKKLYKPCKFFSWMN